VVFFFIFFFVKIARYGEFDKLRREICSKEGGLSKFSLAFQSFGVHINEDNSVSCKEWAPGANKLFLYGDFSKSLMFAFYLIF